MTKEFTVEDLAAEIKAMIETDSYAAFTRLEDEGRLVCTKGLAGDVSRTEFEHIVGSLRFVTIVDDGEIVSIRTAPRFTTPVISHS